MDGGIVYGGCSSCTGHGWILADNDVHGLRIERCDDCGQFDTDEQAVKHVARLARTLQQKHSHEALCALVDTLTNVSIDVKVKED